MTLIDEVWLKSLAYPSREDGGKFLFQMISTCLHYVERKGGGYPRRVVWPRKVTESMCSVYTVYCTVGFIWRILFLLYIAQSRQSAFPPVVWFGTPRPLNAKRVCPPLLWFKGGWAHSPACEGVTLRSWCDCIQWLNGGQKVTLKVIKRRLKV